MDKRFVEDYKKIKPTKDLKTRIMCEVVKATTTEEKLPFYKRMNPLLSGALACVLLIACISVLPMNMLGSGDVSVSYAQSGELIAPASVEGRAYAIAALEGECYEYDKLPNGLLGAEFTFDFEGKTEIETEFGSVYKKNADGTYEEIASKSRIDGNVTLFWAMPQEGTDAESIITFKNRSGKWVITIDRYVDTYKANFIKTE